MIRLLALLCGLVSLVMSPGVVQAHPDAPLAPGAHRITVEGVGLWYRVAGRTEGTPLVFLHGGPGEGSQAFQAIGGPALEKTQRLVYLDQRGAGRSDRPKEARHYSIPILVEDIERLRQHLGVDRIALLGHSFGTMLALEYAARYPDRVSAVIVAAAVPDFPTVLEIHCQRLETADPAAYRRAVAAKGAGAFPRCNPLAAYEGRGGKDYVYRNMFPDPATGVLIDRLDATDGLQNTGELGGALFAQGLLDYRFSGTTQVKAPVLVVAGAKDLQASIEPQRILAAALPRGRMLEYPDNGHFMFVEDPARFARDVTAFLAENR
ncbi:MAG TPA: alpha/beta hydrolase [Sphingomonas sp.]|nr:alpha/beta hydrolase [Sphingomonas sp.]